MRNLRKRNYEERRATKRISIKGTEERQEEKERQKCYSEERGSVSAERA